jgi:nitroreductase
MNDKNILKIIKERQSTRSRFDPTRPITQDDLNAILEAARWAPTPHNMQNFEIIVIDDEKIIERIANIQYTISDDFIKENYEQLSFSEEELLRKKVGLLGTMFPRELRNPNFGSEKNPKEEMISTVGRFLQSNHILLVILYDPNVRAPASEGDFFGKMGLGCVMENMWLMTQSMGIAFHVITALNADSVETEVKSILSIPNHMKIAYSVRIGYPATSSYKYLRVRREIEDFVHHNQFNNKYKS